jgi:hypothetical protein
MLMASLPVIGAATVGPVEGEYECDECHGFLAIQRLKPGEVKVSLGVSGGSCAGEPPITGKARETGGVLKVPYKLGRKQCFAQIQLTGPGALVMRHQYLSQDRGETLVMALS